MPWALSCYVVFTRASLLPALSLGVRPDDRRASLRGARNQRREGTWERLPVRPSIRFLLHGCECTYASVYDAYFGTLRKGNHERKSIRVIHVHMYSHSRDDLCTQARRPAIDPPTHPTPCPFSTPWPRLCMQAHTTGRGQPGRLAYNSTSYYSKQAASYCIECYALRD
ncbi:hypothetical protein GGS23DRAFT_558992 [Durotheca rogersii]|uniref:uncharacterized protein n=1 Tax=Durotheca rogersii TaxID=419775 RepID=UPI0022207112|nr:uncharacterized protein GGS23DRAFT_558992 [Durotheca rogersii]KAI5865384.1 hypothetical protein GGS23DRAFT_558992 [Durotheca rogersii]